LRSEDGDDGSDERWASINFAAATIGINNVP